MEEFNLFLYNSGRFMISETLILYIHIWHSTSHLLFLFVTLRWINNRNNNILLKVQLHSVWQTHSKLELFNDIKLNSEQINIYKFVRRHKYYSQTDQSIWCHFIMREAN